MNEQNLNSYRDALRRMGKRVRDDASAMEEQARVPTGGQADGGLSNAPMHLADIGTDVANQEVNSVLLENEQYLLNESLSALKRIEDGTYGQCEGCGREIGKERLEAIPYTRVCVTCASRQEAGFAANVNDGRPQIETETIAAADKLTTRREKSLEQTQLSNVEAMTAADTHAAGTPGGGTAVGGLAGTNIGRGNPEELELESAMGSGIGDDESEDEEAVAVQAGPAGGARGGTPAGKRSGKTLRTSRRSRNSNAGSHD